MKYYYGTCYVNAVCSYNSGPVLEGSVYSYLCDIRGDNLVNAAASFLLFLLGIPLAKIIPDERNKKEKEKNKKRNMTKTKKH